MIRRQRRSGFTLLEVTLAMAIGIIVLGALYTAVETQLRSAQIARDIVEQSTVARALLTRMANDMSSVINRIPQKGSGGGGGGGGAGGAGGAGGMSGASNATATNTPGGMGSGNMSGGTSSATSDGSTSGTVQIPPGVMGDSATLHLFVTKIPREVIASRADDTPPPVSDTRRISYWYIDGVGLVTQEVQPITSESALDNLPPDVDAESYKILADEVRSLTFSYFDGTNWQDTWDSTQVGTDNVTPIGPPRAIAVEITLQGKGGPDAPVRKYRQVVALITANGATTADNSNQSNGGGTSP